MNPQIRRIVGFAVAALVSIAVLVLLVGGIGYNNAEDWQIHQSIFGGGLTVIDGQGYYPRLFGRVTTYPRYVQYYYTAKDDRGTHGDESIRVTFNDSGTAQIGVYVKLQTPVEQDKRIQFHRLFRGSEESIRDAVEAHMINCVKASGPLMSSTENQTARKAEFNNVIEEMLAKGLFVMKRHTITLEDETIIDGNPVEATAEAVTNTDPVKPRAIKVQATEVMIDKDGVPKVASESPLKRYGMQVEQFSVVETEYDSETLKQFQAKKLAFLLAEQAKAEQQRAVQEKLKIQAQGESEVEKIRQEGEQEKMKAVVAAEKEAEVAELAKTKAVTVAQQAVEVAEQKKLETETLLEIAKIETQTAEQAKLAQIAEAEGKQKALEIGGALSDEQKMLATLKAERDAKVATALAQINSPGVMLIGGAGGEGHPAQNTLQDNLMSLVLLKFMGITGDDDGTFTPKNRHARKAVGDPVLVKE